MLSSDLRLGLPPTVIMPDVCNYCASHPDRPKHVDLAQHPWHHLDCPANKSHRTHRHEAVVHAIRVWADRIGCIVAHEPRHLDPRSGLRPDLEILLGSKMYLPDVTVCNPAAPSWAAKGAFQRLAVARAAELEKHLKYDALAASVGLSLFLLSSKRLELLGRKPVSLSPISSPNLHQFRILGHRGKLCMVFLMRSRLRCRNSMHELCSLLVLMHKLFNVYSFMFSTLVFVCMLSLINT